MTPSSSDDDWERLRTERAAARSALVRDLDALEARARDPFRVKERMRRHPLLVAGIAAGAGALLVNLFMGRHDPAPSPPPAPPRDDAAPGAADAEPDLMKTLRDAAIRVATPWVTRFVEEHLGTRRTGGRARDGAEREPAEPW